MILAIHLKQIDCVMTFGICRAAECKTIKDIAIFAVINRQCLSRQHKIYSDHRSVSKNVIITTVDRGTHIQLKSFATNETKKRLFS